MLSPLAIKLIIKHLDSIDKALSSKLNRTPRPWEETAINHLFVDLFNPSVQEDVKLDFSLSELASSLLAKDELSSVELKIDTHTYSSMMERYVTQSDIGLVIEYKNSAAPENDKRVCWLLQAKRAFPISANPLKYSPHSAFKSSDPTQFRRIGELQRIVGTDFIKFLLYCPRPAHLDPDERRHLTYHRANATGENIFDYTLGLELRDEIMSGSPTLQAGVFIANSDREPTDVASVHERIFTETLPFSWFIVSHFAKSGWQMFPQLFDQSNSLNPLVEMIVTGDIKAIGEISQHFGKDIDFTIFPPVTITISVSDGYLIPDRQN